MKKLLKNQWLYLAFILIFSLGLRIWQNYKLKDIGYDSILSLEIGIRCMAEAYLF